ncbi:MAG: NAD(P)/FAD-dependent oxidoreductase [Candidatus Neomarinimicrobiota bacterium]
MKIGIVGSGISGLTCGYVLNKNHDITIFEKNDYVGGHTHTHEIDHNSQKWSVDTGFIVYNERTYPNFIKILNQLGVERQLTRMGFSIKSEKNNLEYAGHSLNGLFAQRTNLIRPSFIRMLFGMWRFNSEAINDLKSLGSEVTLGQYLKSKNYSEEFIEHYIIPIGAAIWSTVAHEMMNMPVIFFIRFFDNHGLLQIVDRPNWWVIKGGSKRYVEKMISGFENNIRLSSPVKNVKRQKNKVTIYFGFEGEYREEFDIIIFATHSNQSLKMLELPTSDEKTILSSIKYQKNEALLHFDESILPKRKTAWSSWNYLLDEDQRNPVALTYNMNILQSLQSNKTFCVSLNSGDLVDQSKIIKHLSYDHPLFTISSIQAQKRKDEICGKNNTYYCGAYWRNGFHEDGVVSALDVCKKLGDGL